VQFPTAARDRIAIASYPFRDFIASRSHDARASGAAKMDLKDFAAHVSEKFHVHKIEPWTGHFPSLDPKYLEEFRASVESAHSGIADIAVDGEHSPYAKSEAEREASVAFNKKWIDAAAILGSPSVRTSMPPATDTAPNLELAAQSMSRVAEYGAAKNIVVHLENDNPVSEDPFFIVQLIEKVGSPWLHALPDFANSLTTGKVEHAYSGVQSMFKHAYGVCHVKAVEANEKGQVFHVDMARTFAMLKTSGYKGYLSMEFDSPGDPYAGTQELIETTLRFLL
jgi:sugar phosphate isomerase/epimerase